LSIHDLIAGVGHRLTPTDRRIAEAVLDDPTLLAFGTVSDLAARVHTSRPSIVRFATKLGFEGYVDLQRWVRAGVARQLSTPAHRIRQKQRPDARVHAAIERSIHQTLELLDEPRLKRLATPLSRAHSVWVLSGETSRAGAFVLHSGLSMVRDQVRLVEEHDLARDLSSAAKGDAAVVFDFPRYRRATVLAAGSLVDLGVNLVAITDGPLSPLARMTETWCRIPAPAVGPFDSSLPSVAVAELLVLEVVAQLGPKARDRIDRLELLWEATNTFWNADS